MSRCEVCTNAGDRTIEVDGGGTTHVFDTFECAIRALAPGCSRCESRIAGPGAQAGGVFYCGAACAGIASVDASRVSV